MLSREEIRDWLLENCVDDNGDMRLSWLDFSDFEGDIFINAMEVKHSLIQSQQKVGGDLIQNLQRVEGILYQERQKVKGIFRSHTNVSNSELIKRPKYFTRTELEALVGGEFIIEGEE